MDLHGNSLLKETTPDGSSDQNVFDIQQGVAIIIGVKDILKTSNFEQNSSKVFYYDLWGSRQAKYVFLNNSDIDSVEWLDLQPLQPNYFFAPKELNFSFEYNQSFSINDIFLVSSSGITTHRDDLVIDFNKDLLEQKLESFLDDKKSNLEVRGKYFGSDTRGTYQPGDTRDWKMDEKRLSIQNDVKWKDKLTKCLYRPFDVRSVFYHLDAVEFPRYDVMSHLLAATNLSLIVCRQQKETGFKHCFVTEIIGDGNCISINSRERSYYFPLYLYILSQNLCVTLR